MTARQKLFLKIGLIVVALLFAGRAIMRFPWRGTYEAILEANLAVLAAAAIVNLLSLLAKGTGWHIILKAIAPNRWSSAQIGNLLGAAVNCLSISVAGEAVRIDYMVRRDKVPLQGCIVSVVATRLVEGVGIVSFVVIAPLLLPLPAYLRGAQAGAAAVLVVFFVLILIRKNRPPSARLPKFLRTALSSLAEIGSWRRIVWPAILGVLNWTIQWATFHLGLVALHARPSLAASFMALIATNLGGLLRLTPANVGIFQASMVAVLVPFGIPEETGMAASLALQALQTLPTVVLGFIFWAPWRSRKRGKSSPPEKSFPARIND